MAWRAHETPASSEAGVFDYGNLLKRIRPFRGTALPIVKKSADVLKMNNRVA